MEKLEYVVLQSIAALERELVTLRNVLKVYRADLKSEIARIKNK